MNDIIRTKENKETIKVPKNTSLRRNFHLKKRIFAQMTASLAQAIHSLIKQQNTNFKIHYIW